MSALPPGQPQAGSASAITYEAWRVYDQFVAGALVDEIASKEQFSVAQVRADIADMRERMRERYPWITDGEADELRLLYLLADDARSMGEPSALKIAAELGARARDIAQTAAVREKTRRDREGEVYR